MKKSLFGCLLSLAVLVGCGNKISSSSLSEDKEKFLQQDVFCDDNQGNFTDSLVSKKKENVYLLSYTLDSAKMDYHNVRVLLSPKKDSFFFFGYDSSYTLVKDKEKADRDKDIVFGLNINFTSTVELKSLYAFFCSDELNFYYMVNA